MTGPKRVDDLPTVRVSDGEIVTTPDGTTHYLNGMASLIYELCDARDFAAISSSVATIFDLSADESTRLVTEAIAEMRDKGLVV